MRFKETFSVDEAEVLAGRFRSVSGRHYVIHDPKKLTDKYVEAWSNFDISIKDLTIIYYLILILVYNYAHVTRLLERGKWKITN